MLTQRCQLTKTINVSAHKIILTHVYRHLFALARTDLIILLIIIILILLYLISLIDVKYKIL